MSDTEKPMPEFEATRGSYWRSLTRRRKALVIGGAAAATLLLAGVVAGVALRPPGAMPERETTGTVTPAEETSETTAPVEVSTDTSGSVEATPAGAPSGPIAVSPNRAALVAYRRAGSLCIAAEDGTGERALVASTAGVFALSPDGGMLAYVDTGTGKLALANVASGAVTTIGAALQDAPSWSTDSGWLAYTAPGPKVLRATRFGTAAGEVFAGSAPSVSAGDASIVGVTPSGQIALWRVEGLTTLAPSGTATGVATDGSTIYYGAMASDGAATLRSMRTDGSGDRALVDKPAAERGVTLGDLLLSPQGTVLAYTERSDDGYSRLFTVAAGGAKPTALSVRRDCYPLRWAADGGALCFIEGNAFQGDPTALMRVAPDGKSRRLLLNGAGR